MTVTDGHDIGLTISNYPLWSCAFNPCLVGSFIFMEGALCVSVPVGSV